MTETRAARNTAAVDRGSVDLLLRASALIRSGWCQHADARSADGIEVQPWQAEAASWSLLGALVAVLEESHDRGRDLPLAELAGALNELALQIEEDSLELWNDDDARTQDDVIDTLDTAASSAAAKLGNGR